MALNKIIKFDRNSISKQIIIENEFLMRAHSNRLSIDHHRHRHQQQHQRKEMVGISSFTQYTTIILKKKIDVQNANDDHLK